MARHIEQQLSPQTLSNLLKSDQLPGRGDQMQLLIEACGGNAEVSNDSLQPGAV